MVAETLHPSLSMAPSDGKSYQDGVLPKWMRQKSESEQIEDKVRIVHVKPKKADSGLTDRDINEEDFGIDLQEIEIHEESTKSITSNGVSTIHNHGLVPAQLLNAEVLRQLEQHHASSSTEEQTSAKPAQPKKLSMYEKFQQKIKKRRKIQLWGGPQVSLDEQLNPRPTKLPQSEQNRFNWKTGFFRIRQKVAEYRARKREELDKNGRLSGPSFVRTEYERDVPAMSTGTKLFQSIQERFRSFAEPDDDDAAPREGGSFNFKKGIVPKIKDRFSLLRQKKPVAPKKGVFGFGSHATAISPLPGPKKGPPPATSSFTIEGRTNSYTSQKIFTVQEGDEDVEVEDL